MVEVHLNFSDATPHFIRSIPHRKYVFDQMKVHPDKHFRDLGVLKSHIAKHRPSDDFLLRSPVIQKHFQRQRATFCFTSFDPTTCNLVSSNLRIRFGHAVPRADSEFWCELPLTTPNVRDFSTQEAAYEEGRHFLLRGRSVADVPSLVATNDCCFNRMASVLVAENAFAD